MGLETVFNYIDDLNVANPNNDPDQVKEAANHLRGIKSSVLGSFPNLGQAAVTAAAADLNAFVPIGAIVMYNGTFAAIPAQWQLCDGTNGTPDMTDQFAYGTNTEAELGNAGGSADAVVVSHDHTTGSAGSHFHVSGNASGLTAVYGSTAGASNVRPQADTLNSSAYPNTNNAGNHAHTVSTVGSSGTGANIPPYIKLAFIRRMS